MSTDLVGKYLRLRRELLVPDGAPHSSDPHRRRVAQEMKRIGVELELRQPEKAPFLETMPWSDTLA